MKLVKMGWVTHPMFRGNQFAIENPDDEEEMYTFTTNNQVVWFIRGFESGLKKTEQAEFKEPTEESANEAQQELAL